MPNGFSPGLGAPGQREHFSSSAAENLSLVLRQTAWLSLLGVIAVFILFADALIIGPLLPFALICGGIVVLATRGIEFVKKRAGQESWPFYIGAIVLLSAWWIAAGWDIILSFWPSFLLSSLWPSLPALRIDQAAPLWSKVLSLSISAVVLHALWLARYRFSYEIPDPKWSPPIKPREPDIGPLMPHIDTLVIEEEEIPTLRSIAKPIPQYGRPTKPTARNGTANDAPVATAQGDGPAAHSATSISGGLFMGESSYPRLRRDLAEFVQMVGAGVKDPKLSAWESKAQGRDYIWWCDMVDAAALFGLVTPREGGKKIQVLREDWHEVLREIERGLD